MNEVISPQSIYSRLTTRIVGHNVFCYPSVTSTMEVARQLSERGESEGTVVIAGRQTAGRGRIQRRWLSPEGSIALSVILCPQMENLPHLTMLACLATARSIQTVTGLNAQIKWPNDVLISGRKVCGILIENDIRGGKLRHSVVGIGININVDIKDYPEIAGIATSLAEETGHEVNILDIIANLLTGIENLYLKLPGGAGDIFSAWRDSLITLGRQVTVKSGDAVYSGVAEAVDSDGALRLRDAAGTLKRVVAADVTTG